MSILVLVTGVFLTAVLLTGVFKTLALRARLLDLPVSRSSHSRPTPVGGGVSIVCLLLLVISHYFMVGLIPLTEFMALMGAAVIATLGLVDDLQHLDLKWRLPIQLLAATWSVWWLGDVPSIDMGWWQLPTSWLLNGLAVVALVWLLNLYNFMDGIDGLAGSELIYVNLVSLFLVINSGDQVVAVLSATLTAAGAGFLFWNWPPAKVFMGDVGSGFIGFSLGILALLSMHHGSLTVWTWLLLLGVFIVDTTVTLIRRSLNGEKWYQGHANHAYQNAARRYKSHSKVTITVIVINCLWLTPLAWLTVKQPELGIYLTVLGLVPLVVLAIKLQAGKLIAAT